MASVEVYRRCSKRSKRCKLSRCSMCCKRIKSVVSVARLVGLACVASVAGVASVASQCSKCNNKAWVCILFNNNFNFQIHKVFSDPNGRFISNNYSPKWRWLGRELKPRR